LIRKARDKLKDKEEKLAKAKKEMEGLQKQVEVLSDLALIYHLDLSKFKE